VQVSIDGIRSHDLLRGKGSYFSNLGAISWSVDVPCIVGELTKNRDFVPDLKEAASFLK